VPKRRVTIEISSSRLEVALVRGPQVVQRASERVSLNLAEQWGPSLEAIGLVLTKLVASLGAEGADATVLYSSASAALGVYACPRSAGQERAAGAASLALAEAASFPLDSNCFDLFMLASDRPGTGFEPQNHTLAVADTDAVLASLVDCARGAGVNADTLAPLDSALLAQTVHHAMELGKGEGTHLVLWIGEHSSILAAARGGRLRFARQISLGTESLVEALAREVRVGEGSSVTLTGAQVRETLAKTGIPTREQAFMTEPAVGGDAVLPLLQPVLQRWVVEIRQSLRFGLEDAERKGVTLHGLGAGAGVPRLLKILADQLSLPLQEAVAGADAGGAIDAWLGAEPAICLVPRRTMTERSNRRLRRAVLIGAASAAAAIGVDAVLTRADLGRRLDELKQTKSRLQSATSATTLRDQVILEQSALVQARKRAAAKTAEAPAWDAVLAMLARQTPSTMKLVDVQFTMDRGQPTVRLMGRTPMGDASDSQAVLKRYMEALSAVPLVKTCKLGATQRGDSDAGAVQNFEMMLTLVPLPSGDTASPSVLSSVVKEDHP
jgi:Tfp pilus assembly PilM family ATPase